MHKQTNPMQNRADHLKHGLWTITVWDELDVPFLRKSKSLMDDLDKLFAERQGTNVMPKKIEYIGGRRIIWQRKANVITNVGLEDCAKNRTGESNNQSTHHAIGTGNTIPDISNVALDNEIFRKAIPQRKTVNQTERYTSAFFRSDLEEDAIITEAGLLTGEEIAALLISRVTFSPSPLTGTNVITFQMNVTNRNE